MESLCAQYLVFGHWVDDFCELYEEKGLIYWFRPGIALAEGLHLGGLVVPSV